MLNRICLPSDIIASVEFCLLLYRLTLRDLSEILAMRGIEVSHRRRRRQGDRLRSLGTRSSPGPRCARSSPPARRAPARSCEPRACRPAMRPCSCKLLEGAEGHANAGNLALIESSRRPLNTISAHGPSSVPLEAAS